MRINSITDAISNGTRKLGNAILDNKPEGQKLSSGLKSVNRFFQGESFNPGRKAYYVLMGGCVIAPRLIQAREPDEFREILTRDIVTVLTILFAMKGLKSGMCSAAQKKAGIPLVVDEVGKNVSKLKRLGGYLNPEGGIMALDSNQINSRYSRIFTKDELVNLMETVDKEGGNIADMLSVEKKGGFISKLFNRDKKTPLYDAAAEMLGDDFARKTNAEIIDAVKKITPENKTASSGLEKIVGAKMFGEESYNAALRRDTIEKYNTALGESAKKIKADLKKRGLFKKPEEINELARKEAAETARNYRKKRLQEAESGILNGDKNPITYYARNIAANFETLSLALTAGFLGFGLPKLNEQLTMKKHLNKPGTNPEHREREPQQSDTKLPIKNILSKNEKTEIFSRFA